MSTANDDGAHVKGEKLIECKACDGMGEIIWDDENGHFEELCDVCKGTCEVIQSQNERTNDMELKKLQEEAEKLLMLLRDKQPGLITWNIALSEQIQAIVNLAAQGGIRAPGAS